MSNEKDGVERINFFKKMQMSEHKGFEISMFAISVVISLAVVISVIWVGTYFYKANESKISDEDANEGSVTESAIVADEDEESEPTPTPSGNVIVSDNSVDDDIDPDLKTAKKAYTTAVVNLRSSASLTASVVTKVPSGEKVKVISMTDDNWVEVTYKFQSGYIHARYLSTEKVEPIATIEPTVQPQTEATATPHTTVTATPKPTKKPAKATKKPKKTKKPAVEETDEPDDYDEPDETEEVTQEPTVEPTAKPTVRPTQKPTPAPTKEPTAAPENTATPELQGASE